jgi:hypothetical protein
MPNGCERPVHGVWFIQVERWYPDSILGRYLDGKSALEVKISFVV